MEPRYVSTIALDRRILDASVVVEEHESSFDGLVSTSNHLVLGEPIVHIKTTKPIWWTAELR